MISLQQALLLTVTVASVQACSNLLVTPGASSDGSTFIAYAADSSALYGKLQHLPREKNAPGTMKKVYDWDSGAYLGEIAAWEETLNVVGNMNEKQLIIGETTFGGLSSLAGQKSAVLDYGTLIWHTLQKAETAREAIRLFGELTAKYGYASEGESFSIGDTKEVWVLEMISKGPKEHGAVWAAVRVPDGHIAGHANQARITTFPKDDADQAIYAPDVISFARAKGLYNGTDDEFSFSDVYDPVTSLSARICEARVWSMFRQVQNMDSYLPYVQGRDLTHRMPLSIPAHNLTRNASMWMLREHNEHSWFDNTKDEGAEAFHAPYRWRPLVWQSKNLTYLNERTVSTQQTGWHFLGQARGWLPEEVGPIIWFSMDDIATSIYVPFYASVTAIPASWGHPKNDKTLNGDLSKFSFDSAFWVFNMVANLAYGKWDIIYPDVAKEIAAVERGLQAEADAMDAKALALIEQGTSNTEVVSMLTAFSVDKGTKVVKDYLAFWGQLFAKYHDGQITTSNPSEPGCGCDVQENGYDQKWYDRIAADTGDHYRVDASSDNNLENPEVISKLDILGV